MKCQTCGTKMKDLFTSTFCPNEGNHAKSSDPWWFKSDLGYSLTVTGRPIKWEDVCPGIPEPDTIWMYEIKGTK